MIVRAIVIGAALLAAGSASAQTYMARQVIAGVKAASGSGPSVQVPKASCGQLGPNYLLSYPSGSLSAVPLGKVTGTTDQKMVAAQELCSSQNAGLNATFGHPAYCNLVVSDGGVTMYYGRSANVGYTTYQPGNGRGAACVAG